MERFIYEGDEFYRYALAAIRAARSSIVLEMYIFRDDRSGRSFAAALAERARAGVIVTVIYDRVGCIGTPERFWRALREAGVTVLAFHPWRGLRDFFRFLPRRLLLAFFRRNHRKTLVVDERIGFTGGFNIMDECSLEIYGPGRWLDTAYQSDVPAVVLGLQAYFRDSLRRIRGHGQVPRSLHKRTREAIFYPPGDARPLLGVPERIRRKRSEVRRRLPPRMTIVSALKKLMHHSKERIWLTYPYFVPYGGVMRWILRKARRDSGVDVRIYLSTVSDLPWMRDMAVFMARRLHRQGVRIFMFQGGRIPEEAPRFSHAKVALFDDWVGVGTSNLDRRSFLFHLESLVLRKNPPFLSDTEQFFQYLHEYSRPFDEREFRAGPRAYLLYPFRHWL